MAIRNEREIPSNPETARAVEEFLVETGKRMANAENMPMEVNINGRTYLYYDKRLVEISEKRPEEPAEPACVSTYSLTGLVDYIKADVDGKFLPEERTSLVRVINPWTVEVLSAATGHEARRYPRVCCKADIPDISFGRHIETEDFQVMMQTCFLKSEPRDVVMQLAGSVKKEQSMQTSDDGMTQVVQVQTGVVTVGNVSLKNPVPLTPIRTFYEIEQVESPFVLRFDANGRPALFEGDGGAWKTEAVHRIAKWLREQLADCNVVVIS